MSTYSAGKTSLTPRGVYSASTQYERLDVVHSNGNSYLYVNVSPTTGTPVTNTAYWMLLGTRGEQGPKGDTGQTGPSGPQGPKGADGLNANISAAEAATEAANAAAQNANNAAGSLQVAVDAAAAAQASADQAAQSAASVNGPQLQAQIDARVKKSGDTMTGPLDAPTLKEGGVPISNRYDNRENLLINSSFELAEENGAVSIPINQVYGNFRDVWKVFGTGTANFNSGYHLLSQLSGYETITNMYFANRTSEVYLVQPIEELQPGALVRAAQYTASCWIHSEQAVGVTLCDTLHNLPANQWTFIATTFAPYAENGWHWSAERAGFKLYIPNVSGTGNKHVHVALPMVVRGDKPGTWYHLDEKHELTREQRYFFRVGDGWIFGEHVPGWGNMARYPNIHMRVVPTVIKSATTQIYQPATGWQTVIASSAEQNSSETRVLFDVPNQLAAGPFIINGLWALDARYY